MGSLFDFGGDAVKDARDSAAAIAASAEGRSVGHINSNEREKKLQKYGRSLSKKGFSPVNFKSNAYNVGLTKKGGSFTRTGEAQGWMDNLKRGTRTDEQGFNNLLTQLNPGFGRLSQATIARLEQAKRASVGNMREQFARRNLTEGSSFVADQLGSIRSEYDLLQQQAEAESMVKEMQMTGDVIMARGDARLKNISQAMQNMQFEGAMAAQLAQGVSKSMQDLTSMEAELMKFAASIGNQGDIAKANVSAGLSNTHLGQQPEFGAMQAEADRGPAAMLATLGGAALTGGFGSFGGTAAAAAGAAGGAAATPLK